MASDRRPDIIGRRWNDGRFNETTVLQSRWAASSTRLASSHASSGTTTPSTLDQGTLKPTLRALNLQKIKRLIDRVSWKSLLLRASQQLALNAPDAQSAAAAPTTMFKLDFFEYYVLLERVVVLLLAFFNITVSRGTSGGSAGVWGHSFHVNVLEKLDMDDNPLHEALGKDPVRMFLWTAKDFRNKWKDADENDGGATWESQRGDIVGLQLERMVAEILVALEKAYRIAEEKGGQGKAAETAVAQASALSGAPGENADMDMEDAPWEAVEDAMEWEVF